MAVVVTGAKGFIGQNLMIHLRERGVDAEGFDLGDDPVLVAAEIDDAVVRLVTTAAVTRGDVAEVVTARTADLRLDQRGVRLALVQPGRDHLDH